jgi:hypothetical protein
VVPALVELLAMKAPFTVPATLIENTTALAVAFDPDEAEANVI